MEYTPTGKFDAGVVSVNYFFILTASKSDLLGIDSVDFLDRKDFYTNTTSHLGYYVPHLNSVDFLNRLGIFSKSFRYFLKHLTKEKHNNSARSPYDHH